MSFKDDHPNYKSYKEPSGYHYHDVPSSLWTPLESLIEEAGGEDRECLPTIVAKLAVKVRAGHVEPSFAADYIWTVTSKLKECINSGKFYVFMDCLALLCEDGELDVESLNEFLTEYEMGYQATYVFQKIKWTKVEDEDIEVSEDKPLLILSDDNKIIKSSEELNNLKMEKKNIKPTKIFITHSSKDKEYVLLLTELIRNLKVPNDCIICTSDHRHKIPNGEKTYVWLRKQFNESDLHMIFVLSENYYNSNPCLNEMGAAWLAAKKSDLLLLPGFSFKDLKQKEDCLDKTIQGGSIDSDDRDIKAWLANLRDDIIEEFNLERPNELDWEDYRDDFIKNMRKVVVDNTQDGQEDVEDEHDFGELEDENPVLKALVDTSGTVQDISARTGLNEKVVKRKIRQGIESGDIETVGAGPRLEYKLKTKTANHTIVAN